MVSDESAYEANTFGPETAKIPKTKSALQLESESESSDSESDDENNAQIAADKVIEKNPTYNAWESIKDGAADGKYEFKFNTVDKKGQWRVFECYTVSAQQYRFWLEAMPHWGSDLTMGWLHKRKHGSKKTSFDRR